MTTSNMEDQVGQLIAQTTALLDALSVRASDIQAVLGTDASAAIRYCADHLTQILTAVNAAANADADAEQTALDRQAVASDKADTLAAKNTAIEQATLAVQKATETVNNTASALSSANSAATILAQLQAALTSFRSLDLGIFASDADALAYAQANNITLHDGTVYQNSTGENKFRVWDGVSQFKDYDSTAQTLTASAQVSALAAAGSAGQALSYLQQAQTVAQQAAASATTATQQATAAANSATAAANTLTQTQQVKTDTNTIKASVQDLYNQTATQTTAAGNYAIQAANSAASTAALFDNFHDRYLGAKTADPTVDNDGNALLVGALYFNSSSGKMRVYSGGSSTPWIDASAAAFVALSTFKFTAAANQTNFSGADDNGVTLAYTVGASIITLNGSVIDIGVDVTASTGSSVVLASGASAGDVLKVFSFGSFQVADTYSKSAVDGMLSQKLSLSGGTLSGQLWMPAQPCISMRTQTTTNGDALIIWDTAEVAIGISYNSTTKAFTVPVSGKYEITVNGLSTSTTGTRCLLGINTMAPGTSGRIWEAYAPAAYGTLAMTTIVNLVANDYVVVRCSSGGFYSQSGDEFGSFTMKLIG